MAIRKSNYASEEVETDERRAAYERPASHFDNAPKAPTRKLLPEEGVWEQIRGELALVLVPGAFLDWVWPLAAVSLEDYVLRVACPDQRRLDIVTFRKPLFLRTMHALHLDEMQLEFVLVTDRKKAHSY